ncbi:hypothetical protein ACE6H2_016826 [Prunus campanulata]
MAGTHQTLNLMDHGLLLCMAWVYSFLNSYMVLKRACFTTSIYCLFLRFNSYDVIETLCFTLLIPFILLLRSYIILGFNTLELF